MLEERGELSKYITSSALNSKETSRKEKVGNQKKAISSVRKTEI